MSSIEILLRIRINRLDQILYFRTNYPKLDSFIYSFIWFVLMFSIIFVRKTFILGHNWNDSFQDNNYMTDLSSFYGIFALLNLLFILDRSLWFSFTCRIFMYFGLCSLGCKHKTTSQKGQLGVIQAIRSVQVSKSITNREKDISSFFVCLRS